MRLPSFLFVVILIFVDFGTTSPAEDEWCTDFTQRQNRDGIEYFRCTRNGTVAITFDDGPRPGYTEHVIDALRALNVTATFFVVGKTYAYIYDPVSQALVLDAVANGNSIGSHTWSHPNLMELSVTTMVQEMHRLSNALTLLLGQAPTIMRPPFGEYNDEVVRIINGQLGYKLIMWSIDTCDWAHPGDTAAGLAEYEKVLGGTIPSQTPGFIALHHDSLGGGAELATAAVNYARGLGYRLVSLQECLGFDF